MWLQRTLTLNDRRRGFHLITDEILGHLPELQTVHVGVAHLFIQHTSASLALNENVEPEVRADLEAHFNKLVPENEAHYTHTYEGPDDMPAHIKIDLRPFGQAVTKGLTGARWEDDATVVWEEEDYCSPPLAMERAALLDTYFDAIAVEHVRKDEGWTRIAALPKVFGN